MLCPLEIPSQVAVQSGYFAEGAPVVVPHSSMSVNAAPIRDRVACVPHTPARQHKQDADRTLLVARLSLDNDLSGSCRPMVSLDWMLQPAERRICEGTS